jgi:hypothetical protein
VAIRKERSAEMNTRALCEEWHAWTATSSDDELEPTSNGDEEEASASSSRTPVRFSIDRRTTLSIVRARCGAVLFSSSEMVWRMDSRVKVSHWNCGRNGSSSSRECSGEGSCG